MVNKSKEGNLWWTHNGELVRSQDRHYTFVDSQRPKGTELEIFDASAEQAGFYEAVLVKGSCHVRNAFEVQVEGKYLFTSKRRNISPVSGYLSSVLSLRPGPKHNNCKNIEEVLDLSRTF